MANQDRFLYKYRPTIYVVVALIAFYFAKNSKIAIISGLVLLFCGLIIYIMRKSYQENQQKLEQLRLKAKVKSNEEDYAIRIVTKNDVKKIQK